MATSLVKSNPVSPARLAAFEILQRVDAGAYASILLAAKEPELIPADRALTHELVLGVLRRQLWLDALTQHLTNRKISGLDPEVRIALRLGLYQLRFLSRIPASAAVNESVNLVRRARLRSAEGFVNAILRRATREAEYDPLTEILNPIERLSIETSHPRWLLERWANDFGLGHTKEFARANNEMPPLAFRIVRNRSTESEVAGFLKARGSQIVPSKIAKDAWRLTGSAGGLFELAEAGQVYIQDEASQLVGSLLPLKAGERLLDLCAAPGSKTTQIADLAGNQAVVIAADLHETRLRTISRTAQLHGLTSIQTILLDGLEPLPFEQNLFDAVLVDAPCSGTGTLRRNPEIRWRITAADIEELSARQKRLLSNAARVVKPGGRLVYSTCSVEREENEEVIADFLTATADFEPAEGSLKGIRTWPHVDGADGFYIAALRRL